ncbi:MAG: Fe-S protein assembly co-chaperone HscB [Myxococcales bacterium]|nr:Fe-S protein assembly co-chaperone HscB [Myxococcota bacterium]MDW8284124.1 Fe-S protein assembly co-chaperone HscB [Myxococcales bacterium]
MTSEEQTYFDILGLARRYALDPRELEERYRALSRQWHPDVHGRASPAERVRILQRATDLNQAYRVLRNDDERAAYLLRLEGVDIGAEEPGAQAQVDPTFLAEMLELREALAEAQAARDEQAVRAIEAMVRRRCEEARAQVAAGFVRLEAGDRSALADIARRLIELRYLRRFHDELDRYEEARLLDAQG